MSDEYESVYKVITPVGVFDAVFGEEDAPVLYRGDDVAMQFFKIWLSVNQISGEHGVLINVDRITPNELYWFCQPPDSGIIVVPPLEDALNFAEQDEMESDDDEEDEAMDGITIDSGGVYLDKDKDAISATNRLIKYFRDFIVSDFDKAKVPTAIYGWTATGEVMDKEDAKRRLRELIDIAINRKAGVEDITPKQKQRLIDYQHDARVISDYLTKRIRNTGARNLLRTPEMKAKYPEIDNQPRDEFDSAVVDNIEKNNCDPALDSVPRIEKIKLVRELSGIRESMKTVTSGIEKLRFVKRINEIRNILSMFGARDMMEIPLPIKQSP